MLKDYKELILQGLTSCKDNKINFLPCLVVILSMVFFPFLIFFYIPSFINTFITSKELFVRLFALVLGILHVLNLLFTNQVKKTIYPKIIRWLIYFTFLNVFIVFVSTPEKIPFLLGTFEREGGFFTIFLLVMIVYIQFYYLSRRALHYCLYIAYFSGLILSLFCLFQFFGLDPFFYYINSDQFEWRTFSFLGNPVYVSQILGSLLPLSLLFIKDSTSKLEKTLFLFANLLIFLGILTTGTRSTLLALIIITFLWISTQIKKKSRYLLFTLCLILIVLFSPRVGLDDVNTRSVQSRLVIWRYTTELILEKPFGYGLNSFYIHFPSKVEKKFFTLEESLNIFADRIHNEFLHIVFSLGVQQGILYLVFIILVFYTFFTSKNLHSKVISTSILVILIQNQFGFHDIVSFYFFVFLSFLLFSQNKKVTIFKIPLTTTYLKVLFFILILTISSGYYRLFIANYSSFANTLFLYQVNQNRTYDVNINLLKNALSFYPFHSKYWYTLMSIDPSSSSRSTKIIEIIEPSSLNLLAWKGNAFSIHNPDISTMYFEKTVERAPFNPHFTRAYADHLYRNNLDIDLSLSLYQKYLTQVPDFYKWKDNLSAKSKAEQKSYRVFFKNTPDFWNVFEKIELLKSHSSSHSSF